MFKGSGEGEEDGQDCTEKKVIQSFSPGVCASIEWLGPSAILQDPYCFPVVLEMSPVPWDKSITFLSLLSGVPKRAAMLGRAVG